MTTRQLLPTTLALGMAMLTLTTAAWATNSCHVDKFKIRYHKSEVDTYHNKRVVAYCKPDEKPISCEAEIFTSHEYPNEEHKYFVALNELHEYKNGDHASSYYNRQGCWARANTIAANYDGYSWEEPSGEPTILSRTILTEEPRADFYWGLKVYATCVPKYCVDKYEGDGEYEWYEHTPVKEEEVPAE
jgi:hypothetical protein